MKFTYCYKTSDGIRHVEPIEAPSRDEAFAILRKQGIRPIKVTACDGSKANGEERPVGRKRWAAIVLLAVLLTASLIYILATRTEAENPTPRKRAAIESQVVEVKFGDRVARPRPRKQIGLDALVAKQPLTEIFTHPSEVFLAQYAEPGRKHDFSTEIKVDLAEDLRDAIETSIIIKATDERAVAELKHVVAGLKEEAKMMFASGKNFDDLIKYLDAQHQMETKYRETILTGSGTSDEKNRLLSALGLELIK